MTWASCRKASGDMVPGFRVLMATRVVPFHVPTTQQSKRVIRLWQERWFSDLTILGQHAMKVSHNRSTIPPYTELSSCSSTIWWKRHDVPIQTSPKQPCPSLRSRRRDSLGISQASLDKPWVWGFNTGQMSVRLWHSPSACSAETTEDMCWRWSSTVTVSAVFHPSTEPTAIVIDQLLQGAELRAWCDVEAATVQLPDFVVLHIQSFGVVVVQHGQTVGTWRDTMQENSCGRPTSISEWSSEEHYLRVSLLLSWRTWILVWCLVRHAGEGVGGGGVSERRAYPINVPQSIKWSDEEELDKTFSDDVLGSPPEGALS